MKTKTDIQTKAMELKGQQQYDYLLDLLSRAIAEGRALAYAEFEQLIDSCEFQKYNDRWFVNEEELKAKLKQLNSQEKK